MRFSVPKYGTGAIVFLTCIALYWNFYRQPPFDAPADNSVVASTNLSAAVWAPSERNPNCPCPTEIENADCDEGLCSATILINAIALKQRARRPRHGLRFGIDQDSWLNVLEPDPPRALLLFSKTKEIQQVSL